MTAAVWEHGDPGNAYRLKIIQHKGTERTIGFVVRVGEHERTRTQYIKGEGWCEVLLRMTSGRQVQRVKRIVEWVEAQRPELLLRLNFEAWDFIGVLSEEREIRERPLERMVKRYGKAAGLN